MRPTPSMRPIHRTQPSPDESGSGGGARTGLLKLLDPIKRVPSSREQRSLARPRSMSSQVDAPAAPAPPAGLEAAPPAASATPAAAVDQPRQKPAGVRFDINGDGNPDDDSNPDSRPRRARASSIAQLSARASITAGLSAIRSPSVTGHGTMRVTGDVLDDDNAGTAVMVTDRAAKRVGGAALRPGARCECAWSAAAWALMHARPAGRRRRQRRGGAGQGCPLLFARDGRARARAGACDIEPLPLCSTSTCTRRWCTSTATC